MYRVAVQLSANITKFKFDFDSTPYIFQSNGRDQSSRGAIAVLTLYHVYTPSGGLDYSPRQVSDIIHCYSQVAQQAIDSDVHVVGVSSLAAGHRTLVRSNDVDHLSELKLFSFGESPDGNS
jgi:methylmalonyl-CoA mutase cobalamin-binding domain/chain